MPAESTIEREHDGARAIYRMRGAFDRAGAWALRDRIERDPASEVVLDFSLAREFSDLAIAVLAHGITTGTRRVAFRGLRQHQLRILRYCGLPIDERVADPLVDVPIAAQDPRWSSEAQ